MKKFVIGMDGGGTKTHIALFDTDGLLHDFYKTGPSNHEVLQKGFDELKGLLENSFNIITQRNHIKTSDIAFCVFGMSGIDTKSQHNTVSSIIKGLDAGSFILCNDAFLAVKAGTAEGYGISVINGTGFCTAGINPEGKMLQVGGQGYLTGDKGGGYFLGTEAVALVYGYLFKKSKYTLIKDILFEEYKISSKYDFMDTISEKLLDNRQSVSELNRAVFKAAENNDEIALELLHKMYENTAYSVDTLIQELGLSQLGKIKIILAGGINVNAHYKNGHDFFEAYIKVNNPDADTEFNILEYPPVAGAVIWALRCINPSADYYNVINQIKNI